MPWLDVMKMAERLLAVMLVAVLTGAAAAQDLPPTLMTTCGKLLVDQDFAKPLPPFDGKSNGFASGFAGWRYNSAARGGRWEVEDGAFKGMEKVESKHPATASYGFVFKNVVVSCEVRLHDVPLDGRPARRFAVRTTDTKDYVCGLSVSQNGMTMEKADNDHGGPDKPVPFGQVKMEVPLGVWQKVIIEILEDEMVGTLNGRSLTGRHPLIATEKHSIMFVSSGEGAVRNFKVWEALPNPEWPANRAKLQK